MSTCICSPVVLCVYQAPSEQYIQLDTLKFRDEISAVGDYREHDTGIFPLLNEVEKYCIRI